MAGQIVDRRSRTLLGLVFDSLLAELLAHLLEYLGCLIYPQHIAERLFESSADLWSLLGSS